MLNHSEVSQALYEYSFHLLAQQQNPLRSIQCLFAALDFALIPSLEVAIRIRLAEMLISHTDSPWESALQHLNRANSLHSVLDDKKFHILNAISNIYLEEQFLKRKDSEAFVAVIHQALGLCAKAQRADWKLFWQLKLLEFYFIFSPCAQKFTKFLNECLEKGHSKHSEEHLTLLLYKCCWILLHEKSSISSAKAILEEIRAFKVGISSCCSKVQTWFKSVNCLILLREGEIQALKEEIVMENAPFTTLLRLIVNAHEQFPLPEASILQVIESFKEEYFAIQPQLDLHSCWIFRGIPSQELEYRFSFWLYACCLLSPEKFVEDCSLLMQHSMENFQSRGLDLILTKIALFDTSRNENLLKKALENCRFPSLVILVSFLARWNNQSCTIQIIDSIEDFPALAGLKLLVEGVQLLIQGSNQLHFAKYKFFESLKFANAKRSNFSVKLASLCFLGWIYLGTDLVQAVKVIEAALAVCKEPKIERMLRMMSLKAKSL